MKNVLFVDCCIRREASNTKKLAEAFLSALPSDCAVTRLDLMAEDLSYFKDRKSTRLNSSHKVQSRMPSSA